jgi:hypothetical protein
MVGIYYLIWGNVKRNMFLYMVYKTPSPILQGDAAHHSRTDVPAECGSTFSEAALLGNTLRARQSNSSRRCRQVRLYNVPKKD